MPSATQLARVLEPGTTGWTASDLLDPPVESQWVRGQFEIIEGVLTTMAPAYFAGGRALLNLMYVLESHLRSQKIPGRLAPEVDLVIQESRVLRADAVYFSAEQWRAQENAAAEVAGPNDVQRIRILVPPTLVIESVSPGHEAHDRQTKRRWYADFGVPNYWIVDAYAKSLDCLVLQGGIYQTDQGGSGTAELRPALFPGMTVSLAEIFSA